MPNCVETEQLRNASLEHDIDIAFMFEPFSIPIVEVPWIRTDPLALMPPGGIASLKRSPSSPPIFREAAGAINHLRHANGQREVGVLYDEPRQTTFLAQRKSLPWPAANIAATGSSISSRNSAMWSLSPYHSALRGTTLLTASPQRERHLRHHTEQRVTAIHRAERSALGRSTRLGHKLFR